MSWLPACLRELLDAYNLNSISKWIAVSEQAVQQQTRRFRLHVMAKISDSMSI